MLSPLLIGFTENKLNMVDGGLLEFTILGNTLTLSFQHDADTMISVIDGYNQTYIEGLCLQDSGNNT